MLRENIDDIQENGGVGDWSFTKDDTHIAIQLHAGMKGLAILPIKDQANAWQWDGNRDAPTLSPSILHWGGGKDAPATWHGYLRAGKLETA